MDLTLEDRIREIVLTKLAKYNLQWDYINVKVLYDHKRVGVQGDERTYKPPAEVEIGCKGEMVWNIPFIKEMSTEIPNKISEVNGVVYTIQQT